MVEGLVDAIERLFGLAGGGLGMGPGLLDMILLGVVGVGTVRGYLRGGLQQAGSVGGLLLGIWAGTAYASEAADLISSYVQLPRSVDTEIGFIVVLLITRLLVRVGGETLGETMETFGMGSVNKGLGGAIGGYKAALLTSLVLTVGAEMGIPGPQVQSQSQWYNSVRQVLPATWSTAQSVAPRLGALRNAPANFLRKAETSIQSLGASGGSTYRDRLTGGKMRIDGDYSEPFTSQRSGSSEKTRWGRRASRTAGIGGVQEAMENIGETVKSALQGNRPTHSARSRPNGRRFNR